MAIKQIVVLTTEGASWYIKNSEDIKKIENVLPKDITWKKTGTIKDLRNKYFAMLKKLNSDIKTGYTDAALHEAFKPIIFTKLKDFKHLFTSDDLEHSTKNLNIEGWQHLIDELKVIANDIFGYVFNE